MSASDEDRQAGLDAELKRLEEHSRRLFARLSEGEHRFRQIARSSWKIQEQERRSLARELHDGVGQSLTAVKTRLDWLAERVSGETELRGELRELAELTSQALDETRELSRLLRPSILDDLGLEPALSWLARSLSRGLGQGRTTGAAAGAGELRVETAVQGLGQRLDEEEETLLFRIAQEAATNAVKHASASRITIRLDIREGVQLVVEDDGTGFDAARELASNEGTGLRGMRDRVETFGGTLAVHSRPGEGTQVTLKLPLAEHEKRDSLA